MCLAIPGKIIKKTKKEGEVDFDGIRKSVKLDLTPHAQRGDFVIVHAGYAIQIIDKKEAEKFYELFERDK